MTSAKERDPAQKVGIRLIAFRKVRGLTQANLAEKLGIPKSTYVAWERDESEANARLFTAMYREFGAESVLEILGAGTSTGKNRIDWIELGRIASKIDSARKRLNVYLDIEDIVEIAGSIYDRDEKDRAKALEEFKMYLKIQLKYLPRDTPPLRFSELGKAGPRKARPTKQSSVQWHRGQPWMGGDHSEDD